MDFTRKNLSFFIALLLSIALLAGSASGRQNEETWKFAFISDTQGDYSNPADHSCINGPVLRAIAKDIAEERPDFVLVGGDLVNGWHRNGGTDYATQFANWKSAMEPVYKEGISVFPVRGNHESGPDRVALPPLPAHLEPPPGALTKLEEAFKDAFPRAYGYIPKNGPKGEEGLTFGFTHKSVFVIGMDQYGPHPHRVNQEWLDRELAANTKPHVFLYGHEPAFGVGHIDNLAFYPADRDRLWDSFGKGGGRVYFSGHDHFYNRAAIPDKTGNRIYQVIAGTGGGRFRAWSGAYAERERVKGEYSDSGKHGYILVTIEGSRATVAWKALRRANGVDLWEVRDSFSYTLPGVVNKIRGADSGLSAGPPLAPVHP